MKNNMRLSELSQAQAKASTRRKSEAIAFTKLGLLSADSWQASGTIVLENGKIADVGNEKVLAKRWQNRARFIDASGYFITPGLVNGHCHSAMGFFRDHAHGQANMIEKIFFPAEAHLNQRLVESLSLGYALAALESGTTVLCDHYYFATGVAGALDRLGMKGLIGETIADVGGAFPGKTTWQRAQKTFSHWSHSSRVRPLLAPHASDTVSAPLMAEIAQMARSEDIPLHLHLAQTKGERVRTQKLRGLNPIAAMEKSGILGPKTLVVHLVDAEPDEIKILANNNCLIGLCPAAQILYEKLAPLAEFFQRDFRFTLGTDAPAANDGMDMLAEARILALAATDRGVTDGAPLAQRIFRSLSHDPATLAPGFFASALIPGEPADLVFYRQGINQLPIANPWINFIYSVRASQVEHVMIAGEWRLYRRSPTLMSASDVLAEYQSAVRTIAKNAGLPQAPVRLTAI